MSTQATPRPMVPPPNSVPDNDEPNLWERTSMVMGTSFGVSLLIHLCVLSMLAFWILWTPQLDILVIDAAVFDPKKIEEIDTRELKIAPASAPKRDKSPLKPKVDFEIVSPDSPGMGINNGGGDGKGGFGSATSTKSQVFSHIFIVDCTRRTRMQRRRMANELYRAIKKMRSNQRFYIFYHNIGPLRSKPAFRVNTFDERIRRLRSIVEGSYPIHVREWIYRTTIYKIMQPRQALEIAVSMKPQVVYFLTNSELRDDILEMVRKANKSRVIVNTIAVKYAGSAEVLKKIARENSGTYRYVK